jgi:glucan phosphoethanolaminetransferase (alkaline phosphatase superfamily)
MHKTLFSEVSANKKYLLLSTFIAILTFLPQILLSQKQMHTALLYIALLVLSTIPKFSKILFAIFVIYINIANLLIAHIAFHWGYVVPDITPRIEVAFLTPSYEASEYISHYLDSRDYSLFVYTLFVLFLLYRFMKHYAHSYKRVKLIGMGVSLLGILSIMYYTNPLKEMEPFSVPCEVCNVMDEKQEIDRLMFERAKFIQNLKLVKASQEHQLYDKIVIVMGESVNKNHMALYGYDQNTTPFFSSLKTDKNFYIFNAISPTNQTRFSIPIDLTKANVHDFQKSFVHSCSILTDFKANDYKSYWISNQGRAGKNDSTISSMAYEANVTYFANLNYLDAKTDDTLLEYLNSHKSSQSKEMYLIHLMGSHSDYVNRYDHAKALFKKPKNMIEEYDNSIHYTDSILRQIFEHFKGEKLLLIYLSDHGENISMDNNGHGFVPSYKDEYMVPFVIYSNVKNPRIDEIKKDNQKAYINLENFNFMVQYISGISDEKRLSFSSDVISVEPDNIWDFEDMDFYN